MMNPDQIVRAAASVIGEIDPKEAASRLGFSTVEIIIDTSSTEEVIFSEISMDGDGQMRPPDFVYGTPVHPSCLDGTGPQVLAIAPVNVYVYRNVSVVGWRTIVTESGQVFCGVKIGSDLALSRFIRSAETGFEGLFTYAQNTRVFCCYVATARQIDIKGTGLFIASLEPGNYGSFLFRILPQLLLLAESSISYDFLIVGERVAWLLEALDLLGLKSVPVYAVREVYGSKFENLLIIEGIDNEGFLSSQTRRRVKDFSDKCLADSTSRGRNTPRKLYVSRSLGANRSSRYRPLVNESAVEKVVLSNGFQILHPEVHTLKQQVAFFRSAREIIGPSGSGMLNVMFSDAGAKVADLEVHHNTVRQHAKIYSSSEHIYGFVFGQSLGSSINELMFGPWQIDLDLIDRLMKCSI